MPSQGQADSSHAEEESLFMSQEGKMISNASLTFGYGGWGAQARKMKNSKLDFLLGRWFSEALRFLSFGAFPGGAG